MSDDDARRPGRSESRLFRWMKAQPRHAFEVTGVSRQDREPVLQRRGGYQRVGQADARLSPNASPELGDAAIHGQLPERTKEAPDDLLVGGSACEELGAGDDGVVDGVSARIESFARPKVIDQHVSVDEELSHGVDPTP